MSDVAATAPAKKAAPKKAKAPAAHPKYSEMVCTAVNALKERGGSSRQAILKYIVKNFNVSKDEKSVNVHLKMALRAGVKNNSLKQSKGTGASGSFKVGEVKKAVKPKVKKVVKPKKPAVKKPKKVKTPKKAAAAKKPKKATTPKKAAAKPKKAAVKPKKATTPKKAAAAKSKKVKTPAKKAAAKPKKAPAKKPAKK